jgi:hypothetical protein
LFSLAKKKNIRVQTNPKIHTLSMLGHKTLTHFTTLDKHRHTNRGRGRYTHKKKEISRRDSKKNRS